MKMNPTVLYAWRPSTKTAFWLGALVLAIGSALGLDWPAPSVSAQQAQVAVLNAASFNIDRRVAPDSIAAAFGQFVTQNNQSYSATSLPLPTTLGGVRLRINNVDAGLFFVGTQQINFVVPASLADAPSATVQVTNSDGSTRTGTVTIVRSATGIFSARANGQGVAAALTTFDGVVYESVFNPDLSEKPVDPGTAARRNVLVLYTTGVRNVPAANPSDGNGVAESVSVTLQGIPLNVLFAGPVAGLAGLDQINAYLPPEAAGLGSMEVQVSTNNPNATEPQRSNKVTISLGGTIPNVRVTPIAVDTPIDGELTIDDQIQQLDDGTKRTYFFDAYRFTTTQANTTIAVDARLRGNTTLDPAALLYRVNNGTLQFVGEDDQSGGYGNGEVENNNALLLSVLPTPGDYVIFVTSANEQPNGVGTYTVRLRQNVITQANYGTNITNAAITNTDLQTSAGTYLDAYWFQAAANDNIDTRMSSTVFDSFLILQANEGGTPIASDDNSGGNFDARIQRRLGTAGIYILLATPFAPNRTGAYTFSLNRLASVNEAADAPTFTGPQRTLLLNVPGGQRDALAGRAAVRTIEE
jgi:uncharacterized protein (TIGR03437 family)